MLLTVGHGTLDRDGLARLLTGAGVELLVDIRRFPGSRANPAAAKGSVPELTADAGIDYRWEEQLGGRRRLTAAERRDSPDTWWRVDRKSTRLNSSHVSISYAVFCLKKKQKR